MLVFCYGVEREAGLGRKSGSYKFEKRQKELKKQKKKREKLERRQNKDFEDEPQPTLDGDALTGEPGEAEVDAEADAEAEPEQTPEP
jgi:hypothetical protein